MPKSTLQITYIGHATVLIRMGDEYFLTDPNFSKKIFRFHPRLQRPGMPPQEIPNLTGILISQGKHDHFDTLSFKYFKTTTPIVSPQGLGKYISKFFPNPVTEVAPGGHHRFLSTTLYPQPCLIRSYRHVPFRCSAATAYLLKSSGGNVYFAGNTGYGSHFKEAGKKFPIDIALLPIRNTSPGKTGFQGCLNPLEALTAMEDLQARHLIPIRWGTFKTEKTGAREALEQLKKLAQQKGMKQQIEILEPGESFEYTLNPPYPLPLPSLKASRPSRGSGV